MDLSKLDHHELVQKNITKSIITSETPRILPTLEIGNGLSNIAKNIINTSRNDQQLPPLKSNTIKD